MFEDRNNHYNYDSYGVEPYDSKGSNPFEAPKKKRSGRAGIVALVLCCTLLSGAAGVGGAALYLSTSEVQSTTAATSVATTVVAESDRVVELVSSSTGSSAMTADQLYATYVDGCVGITISGNTTNIFGQVSTTAASGSGFVITSDGYIVTNYHVVSDAAESSEMLIEVSFVDGTTYPATLVGYEEDNDVAVLKIEATDLQAVVLGDSDQMVVGETVYAIGNPLGELTFSLTDGIISAMDRLITSEDSTMNMMQTNTAINPGNSGGPLFNSYGEVIGITTAKYSTSSSGTTVEGLGFAIPINDVKDIILDLMDYGYVTGKPYMGVQITSVSDEAQYYGISAGAAVSYVAEGGAAQVAGLQEGDIIIAIDDTAIDSSSALTAAVTAYRAGESAQLTVIRQNEQMTLTITFDEKNDTTEAANQYTESQEEEEVTQPSTQTTPNAGNMPSFGGR